ncbi:hypothetical protein GGI25_005820, partial [Coemansia spiralis]
MPDSNHPSVIPAALAKALSDRLYDKQRSATLKIERLVLDALDADDEQKIYHLIAELSTDYATSEREAARIGGLVALAATAVALTHINIRPFLPHMVPPMVSALSDGESKVRYFACESLYNVAKVSRGNILRWFNDIFDGLARVTADSVKTVKDGADYLDRLIKDIVAEQAAVCLDWYESESPKDNGADEDSQSSRAQSPQQRSRPRLAFSLEKFVPLLSERMHTYKPSTRLYLIEWIRVLDSVPGLDIIGHLPEFLDGLLRFLSDPNDDVRNKTQSLLGELLNEITECVELQQLEHYPVDNASDNGDMEYMGGTVSRTRVRSSTLQSDVHVEGRFAERFFPQNSQRPSRAPSAASHINGSPSSRPLLSPRPPSRSHSRMGHQRSPNDLGHRSSTVSLMSSALLASGHLYGMTDELRMAARRKKIRSERASNALVPGAQVVIEFARCMEILIPHLESNDLEIQGTALGWVYQFTWLCADVVVGFVPQLVNAVLPSVSHPMAPHRHTAEDVNRQLYDLVSYAQDPVKRHVVDAEHQEQSKERKESNRKRAESVADGRTRPLPPVTSATAVSNMRPLSPTTSVHSASGALQMRSRAGSLLQATTAPESPTLQSADPSRVATPTTSRPGNVRSDTQSPSSPSESPASSSSPDHHYLEQPMPMPPLSSILHDELTATDELQPPPDGRFVVDEPFNYEHAATSVMELFAKNVHEPTKVAGMQWLLLLHRKAPWRILTPDDMSFPVLLKMLSDSSESVVKLDLELFAQISQYHSHESESEPSRYLAKFLGSLLQMFATDRVLLETRAALMVRQLCVVLDPQVVFCLFARLLVSPGFVLNEAEGDVDLEFVSVMVQQLGWVLVTAPETEPLRSILRRYDAELAQEPLIASARVAVDRAVASNGKDKGAGARRPPRMSLGSSS